MNTAFPHRRAYDLVALDVGEVLAVEQPGWDVAESGAEAVQLACREALHEVGRRVDEQLPSFEVALGVALGGGADETHQLVEQEVERLHLSIGKVDTVVDALGMRCVQQRLGLVELRDGQQTWPRCPAA